MSEGARRECKPVSSDDGDIAHQVVETELIALMADRHRELFTALGFLVSHDAQTFPLTRPLLAVVSAESSQLEELLDAYGAPASRRWFACREVVATLRSFSRFAYILLHIRDCYPRYHIQECAEEFHRDTDHGLVYAQDVLGSAAGNLLEMLRGRTPHIERIPASTTYTEELPAGLFRADRETRHMQSAQQTILHLATRLLELCEEAHFLKEAAQAPPEKHSALIPDPLGEESLRRLEYGFHSLQALYDTYLSGTDTESADPELSILRGHISVVFHLLEAATLLAHFYERHVMMAAADATVRLSSPLDTSRMLRVLVGYLVRYADSFLARARLVSQSILKRYAETATVSVPVPPYRGFHVRPATLVARIVHHYGSAVEMELLGHVYDASQPLDLFRANEEINATKRHQITERIARMGLPDSRARAHPDLLAAVRGAVLALGEKTEVVIYEQPLQLDPIDVGPEETVTEAIIREVKRLLATGKIDVESHNKVRFTGDRRVLDDIRLLGEHGYGEDRFGNNIPLPAQLGYLRAH